MSSGKKRGRPPTISLAERKRRKVAYERERQRSKIYIGDEMERWNVLKDKENLRFHHEVARFLLDLYDHCENGAVSRRRSKKAVTSTPRESALHFFKSSKKSCTSGFKTLRKSTHVPTQNTSTRSESKFADHGQELENWEKEREKSSSDVTKSSTSLQSSNVSCKMKKTQKEDCGQEEIHGNQDEENITDNFPVKGSESVTEDEEDITDNFPVEGSESVTEDEEHITDNFPVKVSESVTEDEEHNTDNFPVQDSEPTAVPKLVVKAPVNSSAESQNKSNTQQSCSQSSLVYVSREAAVVSAEAVVNQTEPPQERTQPDVAKVKDEILDDQSNTDEHSGQQKDNVLVSQNPLNSITETTVPQPQVFPSYVSLLTGNTETKISGSNNKFFIIQNQPSLQTVGGHVPLMVKNVKTFIPLNNMNVSNARTVNVAGKPVAIGNVQNKPVILGGSVQNNPVILSGGVHNNSVILGGGVQTNPVILGTGNRPSVLPQQQFLLLPTQPPQQRLLLTTQNISQKTEINDKTSSSAAVQPSVMLVNDSRHNILTPVQPTVNVGYGNRDNNATQFVIKPHVGELNKNDDITPNPVNEIAIKKEPVDTGYPHETAKTLPCDESSSISENVTDSAEQGISEIKLEETTQDSREETREDITLNMLCTDEGGTECSQNVTQNKVIYTRCRVLSDQDSVDGTAADLAQTKSGETRKNHEVKDDCDDDEDDGSDELKNNDKGAFYFNYEQVAEDNRRHSSRLKGRRYLSYKRYFGADDADISDDSKKETDKSKDDGTRTESTCSNEQTNEISRDSTTNQTPAVAYDNRKAKKRKKKLQNINQLDSDSDMEEETMLEEGIKTEKDEELISEDEVEMGEYEETEEEDLPENPLKKPKPIIVQTSGVPDKKIDLNDPEHRNKYKMTTFTSSAKRFRHVKKELKSYRRYTCKLCEGAFNTTDKGYMEKHLTKHLQGELTCTDCEKTFSSVKLVMEHRIQKHGNIELKYSCGLCNERFRYGRPLQNHLANVHGQSPFICRYCGERFKEYNKQKEHIHKSHPGMAVKCDRCHQIVMGATAIKYHCEDLKCSITAEGEPKLAQCQMCDKMILRSRLKTHIRRVHLKVKNYRCKFCGFTASNATGHKHHMMTHTASELLNDLPTPETPVAATTRFKPVTQEQMEELYEARQSKSTKKNTSWALKIFQDWNLETNGQIMDMSAVTASVLAEALKKFYCEARPKTGKSGDTDVYHRNSLLSIRTALNRHLSDIHRDIDILRDKQFKYCNGVLDGLLKQRVVNGLAKPTKHKEIIEQSDLEKICAYFRGASNSPIILRHCVWYTLSVHFETRGMKFHVQLKPDSFQFHKDELGEYVTLTHQTQPKNFQGELLSKENHCEKRMYAFPDADNCPVKMLRLLLDKTDKQATSLYNQYHKNALVSPHDTEMWFTSKPLSKRSFSRFLSDICRAAGVETKYTRNCIGATSIQYLNDLGYEARHIMFMSNHKNESSLKSYNMTMSSTQKKSLSNVIAMLTKPSASGSADQASVDLPSFPSNRMPTLNKPVGMEVSSVNPALTYTSQQLNSSFTPGFLTNSSFSHCGFNIQHSGVHSNTGEK